MGAKNLNISGFIFVVVWAFLGAFISGISTKIWIKF